jgi:aminoglycoside phosphotransferase (APT) family kinase protein
MDAFLGQLVAARCGIHAVDGTARELIPRYRRYYDPRSASPPAWSTRRLWERAMEVASEPPPAGRCCLIHRDYHPENTLWSRGRLAGDRRLDECVLGIAGLDTGHKRWNLAVTYGLDVAEEFLRRHRALTAEAFDDQRYWDVVTVVDFVSDIEPSEWADFDLARLERYLESVLSG